MELLGLLQHKIWLKKLCQVVLVTHHFSQKVSTKLEQKQSQDTLPQTDKNKQKDETIAITGSILAMAVSALELVGLKHRPHNK